MYNPHVYFDMSNKDYRNQAGISKSDLDLINTSMLHYFAGRFGDARKETAAFDVGTAVHYYVLEPERFKTHILSYSDALPWIQENRDSKVKEITSKRGNVGQWLEEFRSIVEEKLLAEGDTDAPKMLSDSEKELICNMGKAITSTVFYRKFMRGQKNEVSFMAEWNGMLCKCRADCWNEKAKMVADVKTVTDASPEGFQKAAAEHRYNVQAALYREIMRACGVEVNTFAFIAVEKKAPFATAVYAYDSEAMDEGLEEAKENIETYMEFMQKHFDEPLDENAGWGSMIRTVSLKPWQKRKRMLKRIDNGDDE